MRGHGTVMKWCCPGFKGNYDEAGQRGMGVLIGRNYEGRPEFTLQFRAVGKGNEQFISSSNERIPFSLVVDIGVRYCPWCGRDLEKWYAELVDDFYRPDLKITY
jgi:hypothetical protein